MSQMLDSHLFYFIAGFFSCALLALLGMLLLEKICGQRDELEEIEPEEPKDPRFR
jgi:hypothetical protein